LCKAPPAVSASPPTTASPFRSYRRLPASACLFSNGVELRLAYLPLATISHSCRMILGR
jgi:hypothetical protein